MTNRYLERAGHEERIDHRSHAERGLGAAHHPRGCVARALEKGIVSDRCELNRQIKAENRLLRELKAQFKKITEAVKNTLRHCRSVGKAAGKYADLLLSVRAYPQQQETDDRCLEYSEAKSGTVPLPCAADKGNNQRTEVPTG